MGHFRDSVILPQLPEFVSFSYSNLVTPVNKSFFVSSRNAHLSGEERVVKKTASKETISGYSSHYTGLACVQTLPPLPSGKIHFFFLRGGGGGVCTQAIPDSFV